MTSTESEFVTPREAAEILKVTRRTVDRYAAEGRLNKMHVTARHVLFSRADVDRLITHTLGESTPPAREPLDSPDPRGRERPIDAPIHGRAFGPAGG